nr:hypothetical protein BaRGS_016273 [Batillaria attramentaria]
MEVAVEQAGKDRLEQKYQELEELMTRPLADTRGVHIPQQRIHKMVAMQQKHASVGHRSAYPQRHDNGAIGPWFGDTVQEEEGENDDNAYSTIRVLQTTGPDLHMQVRRKGSVDSSPTSSSGASQHRQEEDRQNDNSAGRYSYDDDRFDDDNTSPRRVYLSNEMHLKYSDNPKLQEWLKRKNAEYRRQKKAERAKKREERNDKMVEQEQKIARREKSSERVKEWMDMKRKEAAIRNKEERRRKKQQARQEAAHRASRSPSGGVMGKRIDRPASAPASRDKKHIPIKRPESAVRLDNGDGTVPKPPDSKFVYKRPVSGRVKLMKLQNERNSRARSADQQRYEALSPEEKEKRARLSYDAWLVAKRKEDQQKKKEAQKQKDLIKSDPEMERIIPELAKKRIERIKSGKKRIDTGMQNIDNAANTSFGGGDFDQESPEAIQEGHPPNDNVPRPSSYKLAVDGAAASLAEVNTRARPVSAKTRMPIPQSALSPRRPKSATPKVKAVMDKDQSDEPNPYKLPFPDHMGVPEQVKRVQEKIFSPHLIASANSERPEPQGCASVETGGCPKGVDGVHSEPPPRASLVLLQEIEAAAVKSEKEAQSLEALEEQATAVETDSKMETPPVEPSDEAAPEETHEELKELQKHLDENEEGTGQKIQSRG